MTSPNFTSNKNENVSILNDLRQTNKRLLIYVTKNESLLKKEFEMAQEINDLKKTISERDTRILELLIINRQLTQVNEPLKKDIDGLKERDKKQDDTINLLKQEISDLNTKIGQMEEEALVQLKLINRSYNGLKKANELLQTKATDLEEIIKNLNKEMQSKDTIINRLETDVAELKKKEAQRQSSAVYVYMADLCNYYLNNKLYPDVLKVFEYGTSGYTNFLQKLKNDGEQPISFLSYFRREYAEDPNIAVQAAPHGVNLGFMLDLINHRNTFTHSYVPYSVTSLLKLSIEGYNHLESKNHQDVLGQMFELYQNFTPSPPPQNKHDAPPDKTNNPFKHFLNKK
ncbi:hypothetical protein ACTFIT_004245 [Dictyostelium discoideum]